jgi:hypothetical protein
MLVLAVLAPFYAGPQQLIPSHWLPDPKPKDGPSTVEHSRWADLIDHRG